MWVSRLWKSIVSEASWLMGFHPALWGKSSCKCWDEVDVSPGIKPLVNSNFSYLQIPCWIDQLREAEYSEKNRKWIEVEVVWKLNRPIIGWSLCHGESEAIAGNPPRKCANPGHLNLGGWHKSRIVHKRHSQHHTNMAKPLWTFYHCLRQLQTLWARILACGCNKDQYLGSRLCWNSKKCPNLFQSLKILFLHGDIDDFAVFPHVFVLSLLSVSFVSGWFHIPFKKGPPKTTGKPNFNTWSKIHSRPKRVKEASTASNVLARS